jgi:GxxExxY protein
MRPEIGTDFRRLRMEKDWQTYEIIGAAMEVHRELGDGFLEAVYQAALVIEFTQRRIPFQAEVELPIECKGMRLSCGCRADFVCFDNVLVEIKAITALVPPNQAQLLNQLKATKYRRGILINFGAASLEYKRMVFGTENNLCESVKSVDQLRI